MMREMEEPSELMDAKECAAFQLGDLVFAKIQGHPPWPARVEAITAKTGSSNDYSVYFFGTSESGVCKEDDLFHYAEWMARYEKPFLRALDEIKEAASVPKCQDTITHEDEETEDEAFFLEETASQIVKDKPGNSQKTSIPETIIPDREEHEMMSDFKEEHVEGMEEEINLEEICHVYLKEELSSSDGESPVEPKTEEQVGKMREKRNVNLSTADHALIVGMVKSGMSLMAVTRETGWSRKTVRKWVRRYKEEGESGILEKRRSGRPRCLSSTEEKNLVTVAKASPNMSSKTMCEKAGIAGASPSTIRRILKRHNIR